MPVGSLWPYSYLFLFFYSVVLDTLDVVCLDMSTGSMLLVETKLIASSEVKTTCCWLRAGDKADCWLRGGGGTGIAYTLPTLPVGPRPIHAGPCVSIGSSNTKGYSGGDSGADGCSITGERLVEEQVIGLSNCRPCNYSMLISSLLVTFLYHII